MRSHARPADCAIQPTRDGEDRIANRFALQPPHVHAIGRDGALARFKEVQVAYDILRQPDSRAAHDRKLRAASSPKIVLTPVETREPSSPAMKAMIVGAVVVCSMVAAGYYMSYQRDQTRKLIAQQELAAKKLEMETEEINRKAQANAQALRARAAAA